MPLLFTVQSNSLLLILIWAFVSGELKDFDEPKVEPLLQSNARSPVGQTISFTPGQPVGELPIFPERPDAVYFVVAVSGGAKSWGRALARTLLDMGPPFSNPQGPPLRPIYVDLPISGRLVFMILKIFIPLSTLTLTSRLKICFNPSQPPQKRNDTLS